MQRRGEARDESRGAVHVPLPPGRCAIISSAALNTVCRGNRGNRGRARRTQIALSYYTIPRQLFAEDSGRLRSTQFPIGVENRAGDLQVKCKLRFCPEIGRSVT